jgi:uncharacterized tellurite resistance protein B-like protein
MLKALKRLLEGEPADAHAPSPHERRHLQLEVAVLLHEARRADYDEGGEESTRAEQALVELFKLERSEAAALLEQGRARAGRLTSFYAPVSVIKREFSMPDRIRLIEHLWRIAFSHEGLHHYEDHYVRKIAHLLYVPNTDSMLARNRARG